ncbi:MAG: hypothetical protein ACXWIA_11690, partial [Candidatus Aminicenantales bacterium]
KMRVRTRTRIQTMAKTTNAVASIFSIRRLSLGEKQRKSYHEAGRTSTKRTRVVTDSAGTGKERDAESPLVSLLL